MKPPLEAPVPAVEKSKEVGFSAVNAESLFDVSEREDQPDDDKFFEPEDKNEESEGELSDSRKRSIDEESSIESEEEGNKDKGPDNRRLLSNAVSSFKETGRKAKSVRRKSESEEEQQLEKEDSEEREKIEEEKEEEEDKIEEDENEEDEEDMEEEEEPQAKRTEEKDQGIEDEKQEEEEEEPRVEFSGDTKPQVNVKTQVGILKIWKAIREQVKQSLTVVFNYVT